MSNKYKTYREAKKAAQRIGFETVREYREGYDQDSKLPVQPENFYKDDWVDWFDYLGRERPSHNPPVSG